MELNRRDFLKGAFATGIVATGAGLAGCAPSAPDSPAQTDEAAYPAGLQASDFEESPVELAPITEFAETREYDVVVVGAGESGLSAVHAALEAGAKVACMQNISTVQTLSK